MVLVYEKRTNYGTARTMRRDCTARNTNPSLFEKFHQPGFFADKELFDAEIWPTTSEVMPTGRKARILNCADLNLD